MNSLQQKLDALQKESRELIQQAQQGIVDAITGNNDISPQRVALVVAQRFTSERIGASFPVLCLLDAVLATQEKEKGHVSAVALSSVTQEFWKLAPPLFEGYCTLGDSQLKEKLMRMLRRWRQRKLLSETIVTQLMDAVEHGPQKAGTAAESSSTAAQATSSSSAPPDSLPSSSVEEVPYTKMQVSTFCAVLRQCTALLEQLPDERAQLYVNAITQEHLSRPSQTSLHFLQHLLAELRKEHQKPTEEEHEVRTVAEIDNGNARAALGKLLDCLSAADATAQAESGLQHDGIATTSTAASAVIRYTSPLFSDVFQRQSLAQRSGFGEFHKRHMGTGSGADAYYPKREASTARPFRIPASKQANGGAVRLWFPNPQAWVSEKDTARLALFSGRGDSQLDRDTSNVFSVARKRGREAGQ